MFTGRFSYASPGRRIQNILSPYRRRSSSEHQDPSLSISTNTQQPPAVSPLPPARPTTVVTLLAKLEKEALDSEELSVNLKHLSSRAKSLSQSLRESFDSSVNTSSADENDASKALIEELQRISQMRPYSVSDSSSGTVAWAEIRIVQFIQAILDYQFNRALDIHRVSLMQIVEEERNTLKHLAVVDGAGFGTPLDQPLSRPRCLAGTREDILRKLEHWAADATAPQIYWLTGGTGSGKSCIAQSFAEQLFVNRTLGASFFLRGASIRGVNSKKICATLAYQAAMSNHSASTIYRKALLGTLTTHRNIMSLSLRDQLRELLILPLMMSNMETVIILDGLDDGVEDNGTCPILPLLLDSISLVPHVKLLLVTGSQLQAQYAGNFGNGKILCQDLAKIDDLARDGDLGMILRAGYHRLGSTTQSSLKTDTIVKAAKGSFAFVSTVVRLMQHEKYETVMEQTLNTLATSSVHAVDALYSHILQMVVDNSYKAALQLLLGYLVVALEPLSPHTAYELIQARFPPNTTNEPVGEVFSPDATSDPSKKITSPTTIIELLKPLSSILIPSGISPKSAITFLDRACCDFLTSQAARTLAPGFYIDRIKYHCLVVQSSFSQMGKSLKANILNLSRRQRQRDITADTIHSKISAATAYCCRYWAIHLQSVDVRDLNHYSSDGRPFQPSGYGVRDLQDFLTHSQLLWFEVLAILEELWRGQESLIVVRKWLLKEEPEDYREMLVSVSEGHKFLVDAFDMLNYSVTFIYSLALPFVTGSFLAKHYASYPASTHYKALLGAETPPAEPVKLEVVRDWVRSVQYSCDGTILAVGGDGFACLFRLASGTPDPRLDLPLRSYHYIYCIAISHQNARVATASDYEISIYDIHGEEVFRFEEIGARTIAFHPSNGDLLLSGSEAGQISLLDLAERKCRMKSYIQDFDGVTCWHGESSILIGRGNGSMEIWAIQKQQDKSGLVYTMSPPINSTPFLSLDETAVTTVASSRNGKLIALGSAGGIVVIYNADTTDELFRTTTSSRIRSLQFPSSAESDMVIFTSGEAAHLLYFDAQYPDSSYTLVYEHSDDVRAGTWSPDGGFIATGSDDCKVRLWKSGDHHSRGITCLDISGDGKLLVSGSKDKTVRVWEVSEGNNHAKQVIHDNPGVINDVFFLPDDAYIVSIDKDNHDSLWFRENEQYRKIWTRSHPYPAYQTSNFRYTHGRNGFYACPGNYWGSIQVDCWTLHGNNLVLAASGLLLSLDDEFVESINHETIPGTNNIKVILECGANKRLSAIWENALANDHHETNPAQLNFLREFGKAQSRKAKTTHGGQLTRLRQSSDHQWILNKDDQNILWVPAARRGSLGYWDDSERRLILGGRSGLLTVVDFTSDDDIEL